MRALLLVPCALATLACGRGTHPHANEGLGMDGDTLRGLVAIVGSEPGTWAVLQMDAGRRAVTLLGDRRLLDRLSGLEATVWGTPDESGMFQVERFEVRGSGGIAAVDGVIERRGGGYVLVTHGGRALPIARLPETLRSSVGARVWLAGPLDRAPDSFGVIADPR